MKLKENEVFEKKYRLNFKISKCKVMKRLKKEMKIYLNKKGFELVGDHTYLGTIVSYDRERELQEMNDEQGLWQMKQTKRVGK